MTHKTITATINPSDSLSILSKLEIHQLRDTSQGGLHELLRRCVLAVLNCDHETDDSRSIFAAYKNFDIEVKQNQRGIEVVLHNAPAVAFVNDQLIRGIKENLFSVLRDIVYFANKVESNRLFELDTSEGMTNAVFHILRNANTIRPQLSPNIVVCWGGHSIGHEEYVYTKDVGYQLGLRGMDICTGCGPGAMKGPMKGATIGHAKQRRESCRYIGVTEPSIIAAESPNPIVNELVVLPDIEKRLEAFVRLGHAFIVFPGGAGTAEEILYLLGTLLHPKNAELPFPLIFTGPKSSESYFKRIDKFIGQTLGKHAQSKYQIIIDNSVAVAEALADSMSFIKNTRESSGDAYYFNWSLHIPDDFQVPFIPTHDNMRALNLSVDQSSHDLAVNLRRVFSGIVAGNVKESGIQAIEAHGPYQVQGDISLMESLDALLSSFADEGRMKLGQTYKPCYEIVGVGASEDITITN